MTEPSSRDFEQISAYLDGQLSGADAARLESRIKADPDLLAAYNGLRQTRHLLRQLPARRAPRSFRLTPQMVGIKLQQRSRVSPFFRLASALAMILLFLGYAVNLSTSGGRLAAPMGAVAPVSTEGVSSYDAASSGLAAEEPTAPAEAMDAAPTEEPSQKLLPPASTQIAEVTQQPDLYNESTATLETARSVEPVATFDESMNAQANPAETLPQPTEETMMLMPYQPEPPAWPVPPFWLLGLLGLAVVSGASAFIVEKRASQTKPTTKEIVLMILALLFAGLLALGIYWMSTPQ